MLHRASLCWIYRFIRVCVFIRISLLLSFTIFLCFSIQLATILYVSFSHEAPEKCKNTKFRIIWRTGNVWNRRQQNMKYIWSFGIIGLRSTLCSVSSGRTQKKPKILLQRKKRRKGWEKGEKSVRKASEKRQKSVRKVSEKRGKSVRNV